MNRPPYKVTALGMILLVFLPFVASATSLNLSGVRTIHVGETYALNVGVEPAGEKIFTIKAVISFPPELLRVKSFTFTDAWMPLAQPGFNEINNEKGILIKTGGYPSGTSARALLGTVRFTGLKEGEAKLQVGDDSVILNSENANVLAERGQATLTILPAPKESPVNKNAASTNAGSAPPAKDVKPTTELESGIKVPDRYVATSTPSDVPSPDKAWLYTKLAFLSVTALVLGQRWVLYLVLAILIYILFRLVRR